jgi:hypothetical protein
MVLAGFSKRYSPAFSDPASMQVMPEDEGVFAADDSVFLSSEAMRRVEYPGCSITNVCGEGVVGSSAVPRPAKQPQREDDQDQPENLPHEALV